MKNWLNFTTHSIKQPHMSQALGKCWGQKHVISSRELFTKGSQGFQVSPESLQDRVHRLELSSPSTSSQLVYLQGARAVLRSQKWQVLCYGSKKTQVPGWAAAYILVGSRQPPGRKWLRLGVRVLLCPTQEDSLQTRSPRWADSLTSFSYGVKGPCLSPNCSAELTERALVSR